MRRALHGALFVLASTGCMDTRSASLGVDRMSDEAVRDDEEGGVEPSDERSFVEDASVSEPNVATEAGLEDTDDPPTAEAADEPDAGSDASASSSDGGSDVERRDAQVRDGGRDGGQYINPICRIEPWHCN